MLLIPNNIYQKFHKNDSLYENSQIFVVQFIPSCEHAGKSAKFFKKRWFHFKKGFSPI